jgi:DNA-binding GntR family transcriptional regulator
MPLGQYHPPVEKRLMRSAAYDILRDAIIRGELAPGEAIRDGELATQMGLSRTPVREALSRLADGGLVELKPGVHTKVARLDRAGVQANLDVLRVLDDLGVRAAVPRLTPDHLQAMRDSNGRFVDSVERQCVADALNADDEFHAVLTGVAGNPVLSRLIDQLHPTIHRILFRKFSTLLGGRDTIDHHHRLIELCATGDAEAAAACSAEHWHRLGGLIHKIFDDDDDLDP